QDEQGPGGLGIRGPVQDPRHAELLQALLQAEADDPQVRRRPAGLVPDELGLRRRRLSDSGQSDEETTGAAPRSLSADLRLRRPRWWSPWIDASVLPSASAISRGERPTMCLRTRTSR